MSTYITYAGVKLLDPGDLMPQSVEQDLPLDYWRYANSYRCPLGGDAGVAWILMANSKFQSLNKNTFQPLVFKDDNTETVTIKKMLPLRGLSMTSSFKSTDEQVMLVQLVDSRWVLNEMTSTPGATSAGSAQYNVRYPFNQRTDTGGPLYYAESLTGGSPYTWDQMLTDLWGNLPSIAGGYPTLPFVPDGTPENFRFIGVSAWQAILQVLAKLRCAIQYNPISDSFGIVQLGQQQAGLQAAIGGLSKRLNFDYYGTDGAVARIPATVRVFFHRIDQQWGVVNDIINPGNVSMTPYYSVDYPTMIAGAIGGTVMPVWDDLPAVYDVSATLTNGTALNSRAAEIGANIVKTIQFSDTRLRQHYNGYSTKILPGSQIKAVVWRDHGNDDSESNGGPMTEVYRYTGENL